MSQNATIGQTSLGSTTASSDALEESKGTLQSSGLGTTNGTTGSSSLFGGGSSYNSPYSGGYGGGMYGGSGMYGGGMYGGGMYGRGMYGMGGMGGMYGMNGMNG